MPIPVTDLDAALIDLVLARQLASGLSERRFVADVLAGGISHTQWNQIKGGQRRLSFATLQVIAANVPESRPLVERIIHERLAAGA